MLHIEINASMSGLLLRTAQRERRRARLEFSSAPIAIATSSGEGSNPITLNRDLQPSTPGLPDPGAPRTVPMAKKSLPDTSLRKARQTAHSVLTNESKSVHTASRRGTEQQAVRAAAIAGNHTHLSGRLSGVACISASSTSLCDDAATTLATRL